MKKIVPVHIQEYPNVTVVPAGVGVTLLTVAELTHNEFVAYYEVENLSTAHAYFIFKVEELVSADYIPDTLNFVRIIHSRRNLALYFKVGSKPTE